MFSLSQRSFAVIFTKIDSRSCLGSAVELDAEFDAGFDADVAEELELSSLFLRNRISIFLNPFNYKNLKSYSEA